MVAPKTGDTSPVAVCSALTALVKDNRELMKEVKRLRHHVSKLAKKLHGKGVELGRMRIEVEECRTKLWNERMGRKEEEVAAEVAPTPVAEVPEPIMAEPLVAVDRRVAEVAWVLVAVEEERIAAPPVAVSVEEMEEEEVFGEAVIKLPDGGEAAVLDTQSSAELLRMARKEKERKRKEWQVVGRGEKKRKVEIVTASMGPRL